MTEPAHFRLCTTCKTPIGFGSKYYACSVSTCNRRPTAMYFCSVPCWDAHVPEARHRDAWAEVETAPTREAWLAERGAAGTEVSRRPATPERSEPAVGASATRRIVSGGPQTATPEDDDDDLPREVLVVVSKLKSYVRARSTMNTSDGVVDVLSDHLRALCRKAIRSAAANSRKTVLARDFEAVLKGQSAASE